MEIPKLYKYLQNDAKLFINPQQRFQPFSLSYHMNFPFDLGRCHNSAQQHYRLTGFLCFSSSCVRPGNRCDKRYNCSIGTAAWTIVPKRGILLLVIACCLQAHWLKGRLRAESKISAFRSRLLHFLSAFLYYFLL